MSADRQTCHRCGATLARTQNGIVLFAVRVLLIRAGKARVQCDCGNLAWVRLLGVLDSEHN